MHNKIIKLLRGVPPLLPVPGKTLHCPKKHRANLLPLSARVWRQHHSPTLTPPHPSFMARFLTSHKRFSSRRSLSRTSDALCAGRIVHPRISRLCRSSASRHSCHSSGEISVPSCGRVRSSQLVDDHPVAVVPAVAVDVVVDCVATVESETNRDSAGFDACELRPMLTNLRALDRVIVAPMSSSSSAMPSNGSGSSSPGGNSETQHIFSGSNFMSPMIRTVAAGLLFIGLPSAVPTDEPVKCAMRAGRVELAAMSKSRRMASLPSQRNFCGFQVISPTTGCRSAPPLQASTWQSLTPLFIYATKVLDEHGGPPLTRPLGGRRPVGFPFLSLQPAVGLGGARDITRKLLLCCDAC